MTRVGVIGAGVMGTGVTQDLRRHGHDVVLVDVGEDVLARAEEEVNRYGLMTRLLGGSEPEPAAVPGEVRYTTDLDSLTDVEFVIENITEDWDLKKDVYPVLDRVCRDDVVFAANTSALPITRLGSLTGRPDRVIGMHYMNPVPLKKTVEVIRGWYTSDESVKRALDLLAATSKEGVVVKDSPGFVSNRVLMLTVNEAVWLVHDGVASPEDVDKIFRDCFGHKMGPLATGDLIGLDTILLSVEVLYEEFNDSKYRPCPLLKKMVDAGLHGRKSGRGFYSYA
ncbi:3-hydroxyacyl-CoA dehydrogenase family protein [Streptomyces ipomoeae]|uniref:3-hydroxyacyl-CoA dehydrogenase family protein n=1 Tax=Streptomyces ipomoeae TaxID=103232 RepID=UPI0011476E8A|nr:3-hydroxyacyl-CoA dehydrogenase NAD-binding domain-containing protein [Streptomyces ipomoeae]MDX2939094.1 3-hydroxyacyl-CoA dehydrogenase NAD-binding domain-containing protein [Streptomyces ipomoeae]TQE30885.1 3-hydroxybutyryl-CoA dehydrogenase [Streptomyces ipomoeae]